MSIPHHRERLLLFTLAAVQFTHIMDFMIMMPLGPQFMRSFGITPTQFGFLVSIYSFAAGLLGFATGFFMDKLDRKRALLFFYGGFVVGTLCCALAPNYFSLLIARTVAGAFGGVAASIIYAIVGDVIPYERRGAAMGVIMTSFSLASILGLPVGLMLTGWFSWHAPFLLLVAIGTVLLVAAHRILPELPPHSHGTAHDAWAQMRTILTHPNHQRAFALISVLAAGSALIYPYLTPSMVTNAKLPESLMWLIYALGGGATLLTSPYFGRISDRFGKLKVFTWLVLISAIPTLAIANMSPSPVWFILLVTTSYMVFTSGRFVPAMAMITASVEPRYRGGFMSVNSAIQQLAAGAATSAAALLVSNDAQGRIVGYARRLAGACDDRRLGVADPTLACRGAGRARGTARCRAGGRSRLNGAPERTVEFDPRTLERRPQCLKLSRRCRAHPRDQHFEFLEPSRGVHAARVRRRRRACRVVEFPMISLHTQHRVIDVSPAYLRGHARPHRIRRRCGLSAERGCRQRE
jgi:predicted MFS family arabinose efflux permease